MRWLLLQALVLLIAAAEPAAATDPVDLAIVIATDTSQSVDEGEAALQRQGFAGALRSPEVIRAIEGGAYGRIAVAYIDWSSPPWNRVVMDWQIIHDAPSAIAFSDALLASPRTYGNGTAIGGALLMAARMLESNGIEATRRVIDVSGDGPDNRRSLGPARESVLARGITINGLPIITGDYGMGDWGGFYGQLDRYYETYVIGGPGAFSLPARGFEEFADAIRRKLILEISGEMPNRQVTEVR